MLRIRRKHRLTKICSFEVVTGAWYHTNLLSSIKTSCATLQLLVVLRRISIHHRTVINSIVTRWVFNLSVSVT
jgi:hypothetical protein